MNLVVVVVGAQALGGPIVFAIPRASDISCVLSHEETAVLEVSDVMT